MNSNVGNNQRQKMYVKSDDILKFFLESSDEVDTLIKCKGSEIELTTSDFDLYEALGSLKDYDNFKINRLVKFLEMVDVVSFRKNKGLEKPILRETRIEELRNIALKKP